MRPPGARGPERYCCQHRTDVRFEKEGGAVRNGELVRERTGAAFETEWGSQLFLRLAEASPIEAIRPLEEFIVARSVEELREFTTGRRNVVHALERMTVWEETFDRAARLLLALAEAENEHWANNASGVFAGCSLLPRERWLPRRSARWIDYL